MGKINSMYDKDNFSEILTYFYIFQYENISGNFDIISVEFTTRNPNHDHFLLGLYILYLETAFLDSNFYMNLSFHHLLQKVVFSFSLVKLERRIISPKETIWRQLQKQLLLKPEFSLFAYPRKEQV